MRISVVILLAAISIVNASPFHIYKRAVDFVPCDPPSTIVLTGKVDPDPVPGTPAKASMSFTTTAESPKLFLTTTVTDGGDAATAKMTVSNLCDGGLKCPVAKGQLVEITSTTDIPADVKAPQIEYNINDGTTTVACGKTGAAGAGAPKEAPKEAPKGDAPKGDAPKGDAPKGDAPKGDGPPPPDAPKGDGPPPPDAPKGDDGPPPPGGAPKGDDGPPPPGGAPKGDDPPAK